MEPSTTKRDNWRTLTDSRRAAISFVNSTGSALASA